MMRVENDLVCKDPLIVINYWDNDEAEEEGEYLSICC